MKTIIPCYLVQLVSFFFQKVNISLPLFLITSNLCAVLWSQIANSLLDLSNSHQLSCVRSTLAELRLTMSLDLNLPNKGRPMWISIPELFLFVTDNLTGAHESYHLTCHMTHIFPWPYGTFFKDFGCLIFALSSVEGTKVLQGCCHCRTTAVISKTRSRSQYWECVSILFM